MRLIALLLGACLVTACAHDVETPLSSEREVFTLVNLHADARENRIYSVNFLLPELIPMCTRISFGSIRSDVVRFRVLGSEKEYSYLFHSSLDEPEEDHLARYFGPRCDRERANQLGPIDREGIESGKPLVGMSKEGVIFAIGYPPPHQTPDLEADQWRYWKRRFDTILLHFENGKLVRIAN